MTQIPKAACLQCGRVMKIHKTGACVEVSTENNEPYYKIFADVYKCPTCDDEVVAGWASGPIARPFQEDYDTTYEPDHQVKF